EFLGVRHGARKVPGPYAAHPQSQRDPDADHGGGERRHGPLDRRAAQSLRGPGALLDPRGRALRHRRPGPTLLGSGSRPGPVQCAGANLPPGGEPQAGAPAGAHQRSGVRRGAGRELPRDRQCPVAGRGGVGRMARIPRKDILDRFQAMIARREPIIGGGAGTGLSAKGEEAGGIDLIVIYNSGRYRMAGRGSLAGLLAYGNANDIVVEMASEVLPVVRRTPVLAGVNGTDPFLLLDPFLGRLAALGFSGVQNFPTVGLIDGVF